MAELGVKNMSLQLETILRVEVAGMEPQCVTMEGEDTYFPVWTVHIDKNGISCFKSHYDCCKDDDSLCKDGTLREGIFTSWFEVLTYFYGTRC